MNIDWRLKRDPKQHPVRFLAGLWQERMSVNFGITRTQLTVKEMGQLKLLRKALGDLTPDVVEWMLDSVNWWHFCQQVRVESGLHQVPPYPHIGFLLAHYPIGLRVMRSRLSNSSTGADFVSRLDQLRHAQMRTLVSVLADGNPERLAQIEAAKTLTDIQRVFIAIVDENAVAPAQHSTLQPEALHQAQKLPLHQRDGQETQV
jgi:hypothetical protein